MWLSRRLSEQTHTSHSIFKNNRITNNFRINAHGIIDSRIPLPQPLNVNIVRVTHVLQQHVAVLELLGAQLTSESGLLAAIEPQMATQGLLLLVGFLALLAAVAHALVVEHFELLIFLEVGGVEYYQAYKWGCY